MREASRIVIRANATLKVLVALLLAATAIHFADNALRLDLYPGPAWFTPGGVILSWLGLPALAWIALRSRSKTLVWLFALTGFLGFDHFLAVPICGVALRCDVTIFTEAAASAALSAYLFFTPQGRLWTAVPL